MRYQWFKLVAVPALVAGMALAQTVPAPASPDAGTNQRHFARHRGFRAGRLAKVLGLTDSQRQQVRAVMKEAAQNARPLRAQLRQDRAQMRDAIKANDAARIQALATTQGQLLGQLAAIRSTAFAKVYNGVLTPEQRNKADQFPAGFRHMRHPRPGRMAPNPSNG